MKKIISLSVVALLATGLTVNAQQLLVKNYASCISNFASDISKIVIEDDIDVVLYDDAASQIIVDGPSAQSSKVKWTVRNNTLYIRSKSGSLKGKVLVTIGVNNLQKIVVNGNSSVKSLGSLRTPSIDVQMSGEGMVAIQNEGRINVKATDGTALDIKKSSGNILVETK